MRHRIVLLVFPVLWVGAALRLHAQEVPEFTMSDTTISVCTGILYDSGGENGLYGNNENITTVIDPGGTISISFINIFNVEPGLDFVTIYDGPDTSSPVLGVFTGTTLPPSLTATSGAFTVVFTSDNSAIYAGFALFWESDNPPPVPPTISIDPLPTCGDVLLPVSFSYPIGCVWLETAQWTVTSNGLELDVIGVDDQCAADSTSGVLLELATPFSFNCTYEVQVILEIPDDCDLIYVYTIPTSFTYAGCGIDAYISTDDESVCPNSCANLTAIVQGCLDYSFEWSEPGWTGPGPHAACPEVATTYSVTVTESPTGNVETFTYTLAVENTGILTPDTTLCQSVPGFFLATEATGWWTGSGIEDEETGWFEPDSAMAGVNVIVFETTACIDTVLITILPISTDNITAACPGTAPFVLNATPSGGTWDGPFTTPDGVFDPNTEGTYTVTYATAQCTDTLVVNVAAISGITTLDSICQSVHTDTIQFSPLGGYWSGPGVLDSLLGVFEPDQMPPGWVSLLYTINGCDQVFDVFIKEIYIGPGFTTTCPDEAPQVFYDGTFAPPGGYWTGNGLIDTQNGIFDPGSVPDGSYSSIYYYAPNGCVDTTTVYNRRTVIHEDQWFFCDGDDAFELIVENILHDPYYGGVWTGPALTNPDDDYWLFDPDVAGVGIHALVYTLNTCSDTLTATVFPNSLQASAFQFCSDEDPIVIEPGQIDGGSWSGNGITDGVQGVFDPGMATPGNFLVYWTTPPGCTDSVAIVVEAFQQAAISGLDPVYCFSETPVPFTATPANGILTGADAGPSFTPDVTGPHTISYTWAGAYCASADTFQLFVHPPIETTLSVSDSILCEGGGALLTVSASGGDPNLLYTYTWSDGGFPVNTHTVSPDATTMIYVITADGCSDPAIDSVLIQVLEPIDVEVLTSDIACYGAQGSAEAVVLTPGSFEVSWNGEVTNTISDIAGSTHDLFVLDLENGCTFDSLVLIPNYPPIVAAFSFNPNADCIAYDDADNVSIIDLSQNAVGGTWIFGNGDTATYTANTTPQPQYPGAGEFEVSLVVYNVGNCPDSASAVLCVLPATPIFIPDIFSPNDDGNNDLLFVRGQGIEQLEFHVWNRWGEEVFFTSDPDQPWDGQHRGQPSPSGNYVYFLRAVLNDGSTTELEGEIALVR